MYDLAVIGAGWAGFNAALRAKELGKKVCLIEKGQIGGTCLNRGCIPTKALIQSAKINSLLKKSSSFGIETSGPGLNFLKIQERKEMIIGQLRQGMQLMLKDIDLFSGQAQILSAEEIMVAGQNIQAKFILIASGSQPLEPSGFKFDGKKIISSDQMLSLQEIPGSLLVIGGGVIGCEFASLFSNLGSRVSIVEMMPQLLPGIDKEAARKIENIFKKRGIKVNTATDARSVEMSNYDLVLLSVGRKPALEGLGLEKLGVQIEKSRILTDSYLRTNIPNVYAAGDCTAGTMLAHFAAYQGIIAAENIASAGSPRKADNKNIPNCIFTDPEISSVGLSEDAAVALGADIKIDKLDFLSSGMARILEEADGFIKIISDVKTQEVLGASIIGPKATELIAVLTLAVSNRLKTSQIRETIFAHPTLSESIADALKRSHGI
jgi:dihydrolipoamide dehydrogenase